MSNYKRLRRHASELVKYRKASSVARKRILIQNLDDEDFIKCIGECCKNILNGNVSLTKKQKVLLRKRKVAIRHVASKETTIRKKKKIIQSSGFLSTILRPIIYVLREMLD
jgi:hypothetical protein